MKPTLAVLFLASLSLSPLFAQNQADTKQRLKTARDLAKQGEDAVPQLEPYLKDTDLGVRIQAVKSLVEIGGPKTVDPLVQATRDNDPEMQIRATDGLVNAYLPGYIKSGISGTLSRAGNTVKAKFTDTNDQVIDAFVQVPDNVIMALGRLSTGGASTTSRANACRALGILRGRAAIPDLIQALHSKDDQVMYEALIALQKIRDVSAGPRITFLIHDLDDRIQSTAIETVGLLRTQEASPDLRDVFNHARDNRIKRSALASLAMLGVADNHDLFVKYLSDKDESLRAAAAEGLARIKNPADRPVIEKDFMDERKMQPRLSMAFALVALGSYDVSEFSALRYLINTLNVSSYKGVAMAFLTELARDINVRQAIYPVLPSATKDEKIQLGTVLSRSGDSASIPYLEKLQMDPDPDVAQESIRSLRALRARIQQ